MPIEREVEPEINVEPDAGLAGNEEQIPTIIDQNKLIKIFQAYLKLQMEVNGEQYKAQDVEPIIRNAGPGLCNGFSAFIGHLFTININNFQKLKERLEEINKLKDLYDKGFDISGRVIDKGKPFKEALLADTAGASDKENLTFKNNKTVALLEEIFSNVIALHEVNPVIQTLQLEKNTFELPEDAKNTFIDLLRSKPVIDSEAARQWCENWADWAKEAGLDEKTWILEQARLEKISQIYTEKGAEEAIKELEWVIQNNQTGKLGVGGQAQWHTLINLIAEKEAPQLKKTFDLPFVYTEAEIPKALTLLFDSFDPDSNKIINLSSSVHATVAYKVKDKFYYWDPNVGVFHGPLTMDKNTPPEKRAATIIANLMIENVYKKMWEVLDGRYHLTLAVYEHSGSKENTLSASEIIDKILEKRGTPYNSKGLINDALANAGRHDDLALIESLIEKGADLNAKGGMSGRTALHWAAYQGHEDLAQSLLATGATIVEKDRDGRTPLHYAAMEGHVKILQSLLRAGAIITEKDNGGLSALHLAAANGHAELVRFLLAAGMLATDKDNAGRTALQFAAGNGHMEILQTLLAAGAIATEKNNAGQTALYAAAGNGHLEILESLLAAGILATDKDNAGQTPLYSAAFTGHVKILPSLLAAGAIATEKDNDGQTALHIAAANGHLEFLESLLAAGAIATEKDYAGRTALHLAAENGHVEVVKFLLALGVDVAEKDNKQQTALHFSTSKEISKLLIQANPKLVVAEDLNARTALHIAAEKGYSGIVELLLEDDANVAAADKEGKTALIIAAGSYSSSSTEIVESLLKADANVAAADKDGKTALHIAAGRYSIETVGLLLQAGANVAAVDKDGKTALHLAAEVGSENMVKILLKADANVDAAVAAADKDGKTALHIAAGKYSIKTVGLLLQAGANVAAVDKDGKTALHLAAEDSAKLGSESMVNILLKADANVDAAVAAADKDGKTALHIASEKGGTGIVIALLKAGVNVAATDKNGKTALDLAKDEDIIALLKAPPEAALGTPQPSELLESPDENLLLAAEVGCVEELEALLKEGANLLAIDEHGKTALHLAAQNGQHAVVEWLLELMLEQKDQKDNYDLTALHWAAMMGHLAVVQSLLRAGASVKEGFLGQTALHFAARYGHTAVVELLLKNGALLVVDDNGQTALDLATDEDVIALLKAPPKAAFGAPKPPVAPVFSTLQSQKGEEVESAPPLPDAEKGSTSKPSS